jgi:hypothetical protein
MSTTIKTWLEFALQQIAAESYIDQVGATSNFSSVLQNGNNNQKYGVRHDKKYGVRHDKNMISCATAYKSSKIAPPIHGPPSPLHHAAQCTSSFDKLRTGLLTRILASSY